MPFADIYKDGICMSLENMDGTMSYNGLGLTDIVPEMADVSSDLNGSDDERCKNAPVSSGDDGVGESYLALDVLCRRRI